MARYRKLQVLTLAPGFVRFTVEDEGDSGTSNDSPSSCKGIPGASWAERLRRRLVRAGPASRFNVGESGGAKYP